VAEELAPERGEATAVLGGRDLAVRRRVVEVRAVGVDLGAAAQPSSMLPPAMIAARNSARRFSPAW
jgi:hypothetical protein